MLYISKQLPKLFKNITINDRDIGMHTEPNRVPKFRESWTFLYRTDPNTFVPNFWRMYFPKKIAVFEFSWKNLFSKLHKLIWRTCFTSLFVWETVVKIKTKGWCTTAFFTILWKWANSGRKWTGNRNFSKPLVLSVNYQEKIAVYYIYLLLRLCDTCEIFYVSKRLLLCCHKEIQINAHTTLIYNFKSKSAHDFN